MGMLKDKKKTDSLFFGPFKTSSKAWEDYNVHKTFNRVLAGAKKFKYIEEE